MTDEATGQVRPDAKLAEVASGLAGARRRKPEAAEKGDTQAKGE